MDYFWRCQKARRASLPEKNIKAAFAVTGIHPFRRAQVLDLVEKAQPIVAHTLETTYPPPSANPGFPAFYTALPANTQEVVDLKRQISESEDVAALWASGVSLADIAETTLAKSLIADETIRQKASGPKKSKSEHHYMSKVMLISCSDLDKARKRSIEKDGTTKAKKELRERRKTEKGYPPLANGVSGSHVTELLRLF